MAATPEGSALTQAHRAAQLALRAALLNDLLILWRLFDPADPRSYDDFAVLAAILIRTRYSDSAGVAAVYYREFLAAEGIASRVTPLLPEDLNEERLRTALYATGFAGTQRALRLGFPLRAAKDQGYVLVSGSASRLALEGGRRTITGTIPTDGLVTGWIRVPSGKACAFCAMLASRGPVYKESTVGFDAHDHCACVPEPYHDGSAWPAVNQQFRDQWNETTAGKGGKDALNAFRAHLEGRATD